MNDVSSITTEVNSNLVTMRDNVVRVGEGIGTVKQIATSIHVGVNILSAALRGLCLLSVNQSSVNKAFINGYLRLTRPQTITQHAENDRKEPDSGSSTVHNSSSGDLKTLHLCGCMEFVSNLLIMLRLAIDACFKYSWLR